MPLTIAIDPKDPLRDIWCFFCEWLAKLRGAHPEEAFQLIDGVQGSLQPPTLQSFSDLLANFSGDPDETYSLADILLEGEEFEACGKDSNVTPNAGDSYFALLYVPLREKSRINHQLVLGFHFVPEEGDGFRALLSYEDPLVL
jgi:hypothetical protein